MAHLTRRRLLRLSGTLGFGLLAGACGSPDASVPTAATATAPLPAPTAAPSSAPAPTATVAVAATAAVPGTAPTVVPATGVPATAVPATVAPPVATPAPAYLAVVHGENAEAVVRGAIEALGGMARFVQPGYDVIIKPNICNANHGPEYASTTNPVVVATLVRMAVEAGAAQVRVMDYPFAGSAESAYATSGIGEAVALAGGVMEIMSPHRYQRADIPEGRDINEWTFYAPILEADLVINVPIAKHHGLARLTLGGKNIMGCIDDRGGMHRNIGQRVADICSRVRPGLTVIDAMRILVANGPTGGDLDDVRATNTVIASHDMVAADAYATSLFGLTPDDIAYIVASHGMGLGTKDLSAVAVSEFSV